MSTIRNANIATVAAQYTQEYRTPYRPDIAFLSTRLSMKRLSTSAQSGSTAVRSGRGHARWQARIRQPRLRSRRALQRTRTARRRALLLLVRGWSGGAEPQARLRIRLGSRSGAWDASAPRIHATRALRPPIGALARRAMQ